MNSSALLAPSRGLRHHRLKRMRWKAPPNERRCGPSATDRGGTILWAEGLLDSGPRAVAVASVLALLALHMLGPGARADTMKMRLTVNGEELTATLADSPTTRDFISLLPLKLTMQDLFGREKFGHLPRGLAEGGKRVRAYDVGDVIYWSPGPDIAIYYRDDGEPIPPPGIIVIGKIESDTETLEVPGPVEVTIELLK
jgi:hypothetical protein